MAAWDRQPQEPGRAFAHFTLHRDQGPHRDLGKTAALAGVSRARLEQLSAKHNWTGRCDQWDAHVIASYDRAFLTETAKRGRQRAQAFTALLGKSLEALRSVDLEKATLAQVAAAMDTAAKGLRLEEGLETSRVSMEVTDARTILSRLPADVRAALLRAFADELGAGGDTRPAGGVPLGLGTGED